MFCKNQEGGLCDDHPIPLPHSRTSSPEPPRRKPLPSKTDIIETLFDYSEFREKLDASKPIHHNAYSLPNSRGTVISTLRIYAFGKSSRVVCFERRFETSQYVGPEKAAEVLKEMVDGFAIPLGSTPGRLRSLL